MQTEKRYKFVSIIAQKIRLIIFNFNRGQEIDHKLSRTLVIPFLKDVGVVQLGRSGAFIEVSVM